MDICSSGKKSLLGSKRTKFTIRVTVGRRTSPTRRMQMAPLERNGWQELSKIKIETPRDPWPVAGVPLPLAAAQPVCAEATGYGTQ